MSVPILLLLMCVEISFGLPYYYKNRNKASGDNKRKISLLFGGGEEAAAGNKYYYGVSSPTFLSGFHFRFISCSLDIRSLRSSSNLYGRKTVKTCTSAALYSIVLVPRKMFHLPVKVRLKQQPRLTHIHSHALLLKVLTLKHVLA